MPELPEVETITRGLRQNILNQRIDAVALRYKPLVTGKFSEQTLIGDSFQKIERHGKYMKLTTKKGLRLLVHLRMTGQLFLADNKYKPDKHVHLLITLQNKQILVYRDIRKFGRWIVIPAQKQFADYINAGVDALAISLEQLQAKMQKYKHKKLKAFLLDQTILAGIGNIYADEICFKLGYDPETEASKVDPTKLHPMIGKILKLAIKNKGTSVSDYLTSTGAKGNFQNILNVYKQKTCRHCGSKIGRKKVAGRTSHVCPNCQH